MLAGLCDSWSLDYKSLYVCEAGVTTSFEVRLENQRSP